MSTPGPGPGHEPAEPPTGSLPVPSPTPTAWVGRATPRPPPPPPPADPYWPPLEHTPPGYTEPYPVYVPPRRRRSGLRVLLLVAGLLTACCAGGATVALLTTASPGGSGSLGEAPPGVGSVVTDGEFEFVVTAVSCGHDSIGTLVKIKPRRGQYCIVELSVKNIGAESQAFTDSLQRALDAQGAEFTADTGAGVVLNKGLGTLWSVIEPGATLTGKIVYDIPPDASIAKIELHQGVLSDGATVTV